MSIGGRSEQIVSVLSIIGLHIYRVLDKFFCVFMGRDGCETVSSHLD